MTWSSDGTSWWDGSNWRPVGPDGRYYSDGRQWVPVPLLAIPMRPGGSPHVVAGTAGWVWNGMSWVPAYSAFPAWPPRPRRPDPLAAVVVGVGVAVTAIAAFLPWVTASTFGLSLSKSGIDGGDGWVTFITAALTLAAAWLLYVGFAKVWARVILLVAAAIVGSVAGLDWNDVSNRIANANRSGYVIGQVGSGIYLTVVGAALLFGAAAVSFRAQSTSRPAALYPR